MKKKIYFLAILSILLCACQSVPLQISEPKEYEPTISQSKPVMEFIGYKIVENDFSVNDADTWKLFKTSLTLKNLGKTLEKNNIALDTSYSYLGIFSLQELELYKSKTRYITFIQVNSDTIYLSSTEDNRALCGLLGFCILGAGISGNLTSEKDTQVAGIILDIASLPFFLNALNISKVRTELSYEGNFDIFIYDTLTKEIVARKTAIIYDEFHEFKGSYTGSEKDKKSIGNYYARIIANELLKKYEELLAEIAF